MIMIIVTLSFSKSSVFKMFSVHTRTQSHAAFSNSSGLKSIFEKFRIQWTISLELCGTVDLTVEMKLLSQISPS